MITNSSGSLIPTHGVLLNKVFTKIESSKLLNSSTTGEEAEHCLKTEKVQCSLSTFLHIMPVVCFVRHICLQLRGSQNLLL